MDWIQLTERRMEEVKSYVKLLSVFEDDYEEETSPANTGEK